MIIQPKYPIKLGTVASLPLVLVTCIKSPEAWQLFSRGNSFSEQRGFQNVLEKGSL